MLPFFSPITLAEVENMNSSLHKDYSLPFCLLSNRLAQALFSQTQAI